jgi:hypothetical protein
MMIFAIDDRDAQRQFRQLECGTQASESGANNHNVRTCVCHAASVRCYSSVRLFDAAVVGLAEILLDAKTHRPKDLRVTMD